MHLLHQDWTTVRCCIMMSLMPHYHVCSWHPHLGSQSNSEFSARFYCLFLRVWMAWHPVILLHFFRNTCSRLLRSVQSLKLTSPETPHLWNNLPLYIRSCTTLNVFCLHFTVEFMYVCLAIDLCLMLMVCKALRPTCVVIKCSIEKNKIDWKILPQVNFFFRTATTGNTAPIRRKTKTPAMMIPNEPENTKKTK